MFNSYRFSSNIISEKTLDIYIKISESYIIIADIFNFENSLISDNIDRINIVIVSCSSPKQFNALGVSTSS